MHGTKTNMILLVVAFVIGLSTASCNTDGRWTQFREIGPLTESANADEGALSFTFADTARLDGAEVDLVEAVLEHRSLYRRHLKQLHDFYRRHGDLVKADWAAFELRGLGGVKQFKYFLDAELPPEELKATESDPEADALLEQGLELMRKGGHGVPALYREDRMVEAANAFQQLVHQHRKSDKIDDAAFYLGEIHRNYLPGQELLAAHWYERAVAWDPNTPHPARFRAAVIYDELLHDRDHALELYHGVVKFGSDAQRARRATQRIHQMTATRRRPLRPSPTLGSETPGQ